MDNESIDRAVEGSEYVIHCAQPVTSDNPKDKSVVVRPAVEGTKSIMVASQKHKVKRVIYTSSISAMYDFLETPNTINESHWSDPTIPSITAYNLSKILAEKAAWEFIENIEEG